VLEPREVTHLRPGAVLPFGLDAKAARSKYEAWAVGPVVAPSECAAPGQTDAGFIGMYVPVLDHDCATSSDYSGQRGDGLRQDDPGRRPDPHETETRWTSAAQRHPEVPIACWCRQPSLPGPISTGWSLGLSDLAPMTERYLRGFGAQHYQLDLAGGFEAAKAKMEPVIRADVHRDIGGDKQTISGWRRPNDARHLQACAAAGLAEQLPLWRQAHSFVINAHRQGAGPAALELAEDRPVVLAVIAALPCWQCCTARN